MKIHKFGALPVSIFPSKESLGMEAASLFASAVKSELNSKDEISVILATGNSQLDFVGSLVKREDIDWSRITVLHMDEYLGMNEAHSASFRLWMKENLVSKVKPKAFQGIKGEHVPVQEEIDRYSQIIEKLEPSICVMGIGENGHLAFNDPPADFETKETIRVVELDRDCRLQQVGEGHFSSLEDAPTHALSLTIKALLRPKTVLVLTPESRKSKAVARALSGEISEGCPASILTSQPQARLLLDEDSASLVNWDTP